MAYSPLDFSSRSIPSEYVEEVSEALQIDDPIATQSILCYSFTTEDNWKLNAWKRIFSVTANIVLNFSFCIVEVQKIVNFVFKELDALHVVEDSTICDVSQSLIYSHYILLRESVLRHTKDCWDYKVLTTQRNKIILSKQSNSVEISPFVTSSYINQIVVGAAGFLANSVFKILGNLTNNSNSTESSFTHSYQQEKLNSVYTVILERHLPYDEPLSQKCVDIKTNIIYMPALERLSTEFLSLIKSSSFDYPNTETPSDIYDVSTVSRVIHCNFIHRFLEKKLGHTISPDDVSIFVWYLCFYSDSNCRPFETSVDLAQKTFLSQKAATGLEATHTNKLRGIKISFSKDPSVQILPEDNAYLLEQYAEELLNNRIKDYETKIIHADLECRKYLKSQRKDSALLWLRKKRMLEAEVQSLQQQIIRIDEARHMRDSSKSLGLVAAVLQTTVHATKTSVPNSTELTEIMNAYEDSLENVKITQHIFDTAAYQDSNLELSKSVEEEYEQLISEQLHNTLDLPDIPTHTIPTIKETLNSLKSLSLKEDLIVSELSE